MKLLFALCLALCACTPTPWLTHHTCTQPYESIGPFVLERCSEDGLPCRVCLYVHEEDGIVCREQFARETCGGDWLPVGHSCGITTEEVEPPSCDLR